MDSLKKPPPLPILQNPNFKVCFTSRKNAIHKKYDTQKNFAETLTSMSPNFPVTTEKSAPIPRGLRFLGVELRRYRAWASRCLSESLIALSKSIGRVFARALTWMAGAGDPVVALADPLSSPDHRPAMSDCESWKLRLIRHFLSYPGPKLYLLR